MYQVCRTQHWRDSQLSSLLRSHLKAKDRAFHMCRNLWRHWLNVRVGVIFSARGGCRHMNCISIWNYLSSFIA